MLFFTRYFGLIIGDEVPHDNKAWVIYKKLREIIHIVTSPTITKSHLFQLEMLITEHHQLYLQQFGDLKPKFHLLVHYSKLMLKIGPMIKLSSMRFESKHREIKRILQGSSSNRNILKSIGIRYQLSLMHFQFTKYKKRYITCGPSIIDHSIHIHFPTANMKRAISSVTINNVTYKKGTIIVANILENGPEYGEICSIYIIEDEIYFRCTSFNLIGFNSHYFAHSVALNIENKQVVNYDSLVIKTPCLLCEKDETIFIATRHIV